MLMMTMTSMGKIYIIGHNHLTKTNHHDWILSLDETKNGMKKKLTIPKNKTNVKKKSLSFLLLFLVYYIGISFMLNTTSLYSINFIVLTYRQNYSKRRKGEDFRI